MFDSLACLRRKLIDRVSSFQPCLLSSENNLKASSRILENLEIDILQIVEN